MSCIYSNLQVYAPQTMKGTVYTTRWRERAARREGGRRGKHWINSISLRWKMWDIFWASGVFGCASVLFERGILVAKLMLCFIKTQYREGNYNMLEDATYICASAWYCMLINIFIEEHMTAALRKDCNGSVRWFSFAFYFPQWILVFVERTHVRGF